MKRITETKRLILRELTVADALHFFQLNSNPDVLRYTGDVPFKSISEAGNFLENYREYENNGYGRWAVISKDSGVFLGWCGLKLNEENWVDLGYRFFQEEWGKGYATESAAASLDYGFNHLNIKEIIGRSDMRNLASIRVLEKLGMHFWKKDKCPGIENTVYYRITKAQYQRRLSSSN